VEASKGAVAGMDFWPVKDSGAPAWLVVFSARNSKREGRHVNGRQRAGAALGLVINAHARARWHSTVRQQRHAASSWCGRSAMPVCLNSKIPIPPQKHDLGFYFLSFISLKPVGYLLNQLHHVTEL
jgi:hypothetical protein